MSLEAKIVHADQQFITGLLKNNNALIKEIYERFSGKVKTFVTQNSGTVDDAADIFQESLIDIYQQARDRALQLTCPFEPFLLLVCKRKWLNELKKRNRQGVTKDLDDLSGIGEDTFAVAEQLKLQDEKSTLYMEMFEMLGEKPLRWNEMKQF